MNEAIKLIRDNIVMIFPGGVLFVLILASGALCLLRRKKDALFLAGLSGAVNLVIFFLPLTALIMKDYLRDGSVYWRVFWTVPYLIWLAAAGTELCTRPRKKAFRLLAGAGAALLIVLSGRMVWQGDVFEHAESFDKLPQITMTTVSVINENAEKTGNPYKKLCAPVDIRCGVRQLDASILNAGRRRLDAALADIDDSDAYYYNIIDGIWEDTKGTLFWYLRYYEANYMLTRTEYGFQRDLKILKYQKIYDQDGWEIWYHPEMTNTRLPGEYAYELENDPA